MNELSIKMFLTGVQNRQAGNFLQERNGSLL